MTTLSYFKDILDQKRLSVMTRSRKIEMIILVRRILLLIIAQGLAVAISMKASSAV